MLLKDIEALRNFMLRVKLSILNFKSNGKMQMQM